MCKKYLAYVVWAVAFAACSDDNSVSPSNDPLALNSSSSIESLSSSVEALPVLSSATEAASSSDAEVSAPSSSSATIAAERVVVAECGAADDSAAENSAQAVAVSPTLETITMVTTEVPSVEWSEDQMTYAPPTYTVVELPKVQTYIIKYGIAPATYQLDIKNFMGPCDIRGAYTMERSGDTLKISFKEEIGMVNCICDMHLVFDMDAGDSDARFVKIGGNTLNVDAWILPVEDPPVVVYAETSAPAYNDSTGKTQYALGVCKKNALEETGTAGSAMGIASVKSFAAEKKTASIVSDGNGKFQVFIPSVSDYCCIDALLVLERDGDVLSISYDMTKAAGESAVTNSDGLSIQVGPTVCTCVCFSDHWFDIPAEYADVQTVKFGNAQYEIVR